MKTIEFKFEMFEKELNTAMYNKGYQEITMRNTVNKYFHGVLTKVYLTDTDYIISYSKYSNIYFNYYIDGNTERISCKYKDFVDTAVYDALHGGFDLQYFVMNNCTAKHVFENLYGNAYKNLEDYFAK